MLLALPAALLYRIAMPPFCIDTGQTVIDTDPVSLRAAFEREHSLVFEHTFDPELRDRLVGQAAQASFAEDHVEHIGPRAIEAPQRVGPLLSLLLGRHAWLDWLSVATGAAPLRAVAGRLVQTRANGSDLLDWHDDLLDTRRLLGLVLNLSDATYAGGDFQLRRKGELEPFRTYRHDRPGSLMVFAVRADIEHRVTPLTGGGPRRVWAGWAMSEPEFAGDPLARRA